MQTKHVLASLLLVLSACSRSVIIESTPATSATAAAPAAFAWTTHAPMPTARQEMAAAVVGGKIYVTGGISDGDEQTIATVEVYDPAKDAWTSAPPMPGPRHHAWAAALNGKLYVVGGYASLARPWPAQATLFEFDPARNAWTSKHDMPTARGAHVVTAYKGKLYVIGGATPRQQLTTVEIYDPATDSWSTGAPMPTAREHISSELIGGKIYVAAGRAPRPGNINNFALLEAYAPDTNTWSTHAPMPTARGGLSTGLLNGRLYAFGGEYMGGVFDASEEYTPATDSWRVVQTMSPGRTGSIAATIGNRIYLIGGAGAPGAGSLNQSFAKQQ